MIGKTISHYRITEQIGEGGMGIVYKAIDTRLDRTVAIKFLPPHLQSDEQAKSRFMHEAKAASALNHANIAVVHEIGESSDGRMFIVMAYYEGQTLKERIEGGLLDVNDALAIVSQLASGLGKAHEKDILHRDIKPANVLLGDDGHAKLADFGLAKLAGRTQLTRTGTTMGTVAYMSPEQAGGKEVDHRSDIFSLGVVLYELLTGELPFRGDHEAAVLYGVMNSDPAPLDAHRKGLDEGLQGIVDKALSKDPASRYQTATDMLVALEGLAGGGAHTAAGTGRRWIWTKKFVLPLALLTLVAAGGLGGYQLLKDPSPPLQPSGEIANLVIAVAPFWGQNAEAVEEGIVMQALVERKLTEVLGKDESVTILGKKEVLEAPQSKDDAQALGQEHGATIVIWGEVLVLRGEVEIQPYLTYVKWFREGGDRMPQGMQASLEGANQLGLRKAKAEDIGQLTIQMAASIYNNIDPERALTLLRKISPPTSESLLRQGLLLLERGEPSQAKMAFDQALELDPEGARPAWGMARFYSQRNDHEMALKWHAKAIEADSSFIAPYAGISVLLMEQGKYEEAKQLLDTALIRFPQYWVYVNMASLYSRQKNYDEARRWVEKSIEIADNPAQLGNSYVFLGALHRFQGEDDEALLLYEKSIEADPEQWRPYLNIGNIKYENQEYEEAIQWYKRGAQMDWGKVHILFPVSYMILGRYAEAAEVLHRMVEMHPKDLYNVLLFSICLYSVGEGEEAAELLARRAKETAGDPWIAPVVSFYAGDITEDELLTLSEAEDPGVDNGQKCEAYYYVGMAKLLGFPGEVQPDTSAAMSCFDQCIATDLEENMEYKLAKRMLGSR